MSAQNRAKWFGKERSTGRLVLVDQVLSRGKTLQAQAIFAEATGEFEKTAIENSLEPC
ncbi:hypothetical protein [Rhizobium sp. CG5]|uniref:hypothetical protein n=1 Tax=Rhizobium sp. CG5 TaxID=2726076 RepID=UPI0020342337|nr:hypothetical protein [Rhizobium sp. CG5]